MPSSVQSFGAGGSGAQFEWCISERIQKRAQRLGVVVLDAARFVKHDTAEHRWVESVQPIVVRDVDPSANVCAVAAHGHADADLRPFVCGLLRDGQRRQDQHRRFVCLRTASAHASCIRLLPRPVSAKIAARPRRIAQAVGAD